MVSIRYKILVKSELDKLGIAHGVVDLGEVEIEGSNTPEQNNQLKIALLKSDLELMVDKKAVIIEKIKKVFIEMIHYEDAPQTKKHLLYK